MDKLNFINEVWVFIEQRDGTPADVSFELLCKGRKLADSMGGTLKAILPGHNVQEIAKKTFLYGADEAIVIDHPTLKQYRTLPYARILQKLIKERTPRIVLFGATVAGMHFSRQKLCCMRKSAQTTSASSIRAPNCHPFS